MARGTVAGWMRSPDLTRDGSPRPPKLVVPVRAFISMALAHRRGHPERTGNFETLPYPISFNWASKRDPLYFERRDGHVATLPHLGGRTEEFRSRRYRAASDDDEDEMNEDVREARLVRECLED